MNKSKQKHCQVCMHVSVCVCVHILNMERAIEMHVRLYRPRSAKSKPSLVRGGISLIDFIVYFYA
jgi:hypothetical protein